MPIEIYSWLDQAQLKLQNTFGPRLRFIGLQGSYGRGEASANSDIDLVVILDSVSPGDWSTYRALLSELPYPELVCGFFSGAAELACWDRADLFQFVHDTIPIFGDLDVLTPPIGREDAARALHRAVCDLYHMAGHNLLHGREISVLQGLFKSAAFTLRAKHFLDTGEFLHTTASLDAALSPEDRDILHGGNGLSQKNLEERSLLLLTWASRVMRAAVNLPASVIQ